MDNNYYFLRAAKAIFKMLAWLILLLCVVAGLVVLTVKRPFVGLEVPTIPRVLGVAYILTGCLFWLICNTISELIRILLDIRGSS